MSLADVAEQAGEAACHHASQAAALLADAAAGQSFDLRVIERELEGLKGAYYVLSGCAMTLATERRDPRATPTPEARTA